MKLGLVLEGGGMKCAFAAGVLDRFLDDGIQFDYLIGVSAGSANGASFLAGQRGRNKRFYTDYIQDEEYLSIKNFLKTGNYFGLSYIYGDITNEDGKDPLDFDAMMSNPTEYCAVATNARTGKPTYFYKDRLKRNDYRVVMASCALPAVCKPIELDGEFYYDGGVTDSIPVRKALSDGCDRVVVVLSKPRTYEPKPEKHKAAYTILCRRYPRIVQALNRRHIMIEEHLLYLREMEAAGKAFVIAPVDPPKMSTYAKDPVLEQQLYDMGLEEYDRQQARLRAFMQPSEITQAL